MLNVATLAPVLQTLFTDRADALARDTGFIRRVRAFSGAQFLQALVCGLLQRPQAPLEDLGEIVRPSHTRRVRLKLTADRARRLHGRRVAPLESV